MLKMQRSNTVLVFIFLLAVCSTVQGCDRKSNTGKGAIVPIKTYYIGRFSVAVPIEMKLINSTYEFAYAEIDEIVWPKGISNEQTRIAEWGRFMAELHHIKPPKGGKNVIIKMRDFQEVGQWAKGVYYYYDSFNDFDGRWALLVDMGPVGVWFKGNSVVDKEKVNHYLEKNIETSGKFYKYFALDNQIKLPQGDWFYLKHGAINLPYEEQEESFARFEGHPLGLVLDINMEMDVGYYRETVSLIEKSKELLSEAALVHGVSASKIRLGKREVAGMKGEESILRASDNGNKSLLFAWEFNGKEDSGEYPTTTIEMEAPDGKLEEKIAIWDAVLDSMKPMFERKK